MIWTLLLSKALLAEQPYQDRIQAIQKQNESIRNQMRRMGIQVGPKSELGSGEKRSPKEWMVVHEATKRIASAAGKLIFGTLHNSLIVGGEPSPAIVVLNANQGVFSNLRLLGHARASGTDGRIAIEFDRLILNSSRSEAITALALDDLGAVGLKANVISTKALSVAGAIGTSFISGIAAASQSQTTNALGFSQTQISPKNAVLQGLAQTAADQSKRLLHEATEERAVLLLDAGTEISIYLKEEVRL